ncbi:MAG: anthranilate phosphoribosyltransferase, partial [Sphingomonas sp.]
MTSFALLPDPSTPLARQSAAQAFADMLDGHVPEAEIETFLIALAERGETSIEIAEAARALRARVVPVSAPEGAIDVCGTGGDGHHTLNVSTAVSLVVAAAGVPVAKHGNRAASSKSGAADTLEALGLNLDRAASRAEESLNDIGIAFLFAQHHHPALARLGPIRRRIARRTIFNLMGPLSNPAHVGRQLIGIARPDYVPVYAEALRLLGTEAALVVSGDEGLDELSGAGASRIAVIGELPVGESVSPADAGLPLHPTSAIHGGDPAYNAAALRRLLLGETGA